MSRFTAIDLSAMAPPDVVQVPDYLALVSERKADIVARLRASPGVEAELADAVEATLQIEGELITKLIESGGYRQTIHFARVNDAARAVMLALAAGPDLDHLGAYYGVERAVVTPATNSTPAVMESDDRFRRRIQLAPEALSTAGPLGAYLFHVYGVDPSIRSVGARRIVEVDGDNNKVVTVAIGLLVDDGERGVPSANLIAKVIARLGEEDIRPLTDEVIVAAPQITDFAVDVALKVGAGPDPALVVATARKAIEAFVAKRFIIDQPIYVSALSAIAHVPGVESATVLSPTSDVIPSPGGAAYAASINVSAI